MANKTQAKAAIDSAATTFKNDIDNTLPVGVNISDGRIDFNPTKGLLTMDAGNLATATSWRDSIQANLTAQGRVFQTRSTLGRRLDPAPDGQHEIVIFSTLATYKITNF